MVTRKNLKSNALISVYDKSHLTKICAVLSKYNIGIISTGETAKKITSLGYKCREISKITKFKEILEGRVKTLHPKIYSSLLFKRDKLEHVQMFEKLNFPKIDFVIANFYPFSKISKGDKIQKIEMIDIGGPSMIRSASKNFNFVTTICSQKYYSSFISELEKNNGKTSLKFREKMAKENFKITSEYDLSIHKWFNDKNYKTATSNKIKIKYGENPNQKAFFIKNTKNNIFDNQINGKEISYNNILDISEGLACLYEFSEPTCVIIKHNNPCGVASSKSIRKAYLKAYESDPMSAFGGVVLFNKKIDPKLAKIINKKFTEVIVAPEINKKTLNVLNLKKNLIIIDSKNLKQNKNILFKSVNSGLLLQEQNLTKIIKSKLKKMSSCAAPIKIIDDLIFALKVSKHVKSNSVVLAKNKQTLGIGAGQMSRLDSTKFAIMKYRDRFKNKKCVCASDAFFPFTDSLKLLNKNNCVAIAQPEGSKNDPKIIDYANKNKIPLFFIKNRLFKH